ncbi:MAG: diphosphomevalonate decarboxylase [Pseudomonadota bacterium]
MADAFDALLPARLPEPVEAEVYAPSNIALSKYWGKRDAALNLPLNSSLSISLADWGTRTRVVPADADAVVLNGIKVDSGDAFARKVLRFVDRFRRGQDAPVRIETVNSIPTAAGLASSASGFAALTGALNGAFQVGLSLEAQSMLSRYGSGSATRSFWHGFVRWDRGEVADGADSHGRALDVVWPEFRIAIVPVDTGPKAQSSTDGMTHTVETSPLFPPWPARAEADCADIERAVRARDFATLGALAEANALAMHATMMAARPALTYLKPESWAVLGRLWAARADGLEAYATMDAGANVKLIFLAESEADVRSNFPTAEVILPFSSN